VTQLTPTIQLSGTHFLTFLITNVYIIATVYRIKILHLGILLYFIKINIIFKTSIVLKKKLSILNNIVKPPLTGTSQQRTFF
jgi:hypothetical protein